MRTSTTLVSILALSSVAVAQQHVFVPAGAETAEQASLQTISGFDHSSRQQILVDASAMTSVLGYDLTEISFRRDGGWTKELESGLADMTIVISPTSTIPSQASPEFANNLDPNAANHVTVFSGSVALPASPSASGRTVSWNNASDVVTIQFSTTYAYLGGNLCIDIQGSPVSGSESGYWCVDGAIGPEKGVAIRVGHSCNPHGRASASSRGLTAGSTTRFRGYGTAAAPGAFFMGTPFPAFDLSLIGVSAPGCELLVSPFATIPVSFQPIEVGDPIGVSRLQIRFPAMQGSLGLAFRIQFASLTTTVETTNAVDCVVSAQLPTSTSSMVIAPDGGTNPTTGVVHSNSAPVIRFTAEVP